jgi:hypothetical protein
VNIRCRPVTNAHRLKTADENVTVNGVALRALLRKLAHTATLLMSELE